MIFGEHRISGLTFAAAQNHGDSAILEIGHQGRDELGNPDFWSTVLDRREVEQLRELCDEALA